MVKARSSATSLRVQAPEKQAMTLPANLTSLGNSKPTHATRIKDRSRQTKKASRGVKISKRKARRSGTKSQVPEFSTDYLTSEQAKSFAFQSSTKAKDFEQHATAFSEYLCPLIFGVHGDAWAASVEEMAAGFEEQLSAELGDLWSNFEEREQIIDTWMERLESASQGQTSAAYVSGGAKAFKVQRKIEKAIDQAYMRAHITQRKREKKAWKAANVRKESLSKNDIRRLHDLSQTRLAQRRDVPDTVSKWLIRSKLREAELQLTKRYQHVTGDTKLPKQQQKQVRKQLERFEKSYLLRATQGIAWDSLRKTMDRELANWLENLSKRHGF